MIPSVAKAVGEPAKNVTGRIGRQPTSGKPLTWVVAPGLLATNAQPRVRKIRAWVITNLTGSLLTTSISCGLLKVWHGLSISLRCGFLEPAWTWVANEPRRVKSNLFDELLINIHFNSRVQKEQR